MRGESLQDVFTRVGNPHRAELREDDLVVLHGLLVRIAAEESVLVHDLAVVERELVHEGQTVEPVLVRRVSNFEETWTHSHETASKPTGKLSCDAKKERKNNIRD